MDSPLLSRIRGRQSSEGREDLASVPRRQQRDRKWYRAKKYQGKGLAHQQQFPVSPWEKFHLSSNLQLSCRKALLSSRSNPDCLAPGLSDAPASWEAFSPGLGSDQTGVFHHPIQYLSTLLPHMLPRSSAPSSIPLSPSRVLRCPLSQTKMSSSMDLPCSSPCRC